MASTEREKAGHRLGIHRVLEGGSVLPQSATRLDNALPIYSNEVLISVKRLNIDAASFVQMESDFGGDPKAISDQIAKNCQQQGKQQNPVTGSGGMLLGEVVQVGSTYNGVFGARVGQHVATLVSLTCTPLRLDRILSIDLKTHQVDVEGYAILFESGIAAEMPKDLPETVSLAVLDVAGAPAWCRALAEPNQTVVVFGAGGKAGLLCCVAARDQVGKNGKVIGIEPNASAAERLQSLNVCDAVLEVDAGDNLSVLSRLEAATHGKMGDVVINVVSAPNTEISSILAARPDGKVVFFGMATGFSKAALGAESVGSSVQMIIGNGYYPGHADYALNLLRKHSNLKKLFCERYQA
ncbi:MAG: zinc-binding dehydrogenase [Bdellovibrionales bacterium]|nr:zinc-binding dehydrogenase [Bdellovibrionales bacterium]